MKKISIVVPMYGVEKYIRECLESVANQTYKNIECLIVDDCGPDKSYGVASDFIKKYKGDIDFKILRHEFNKGLSAARNTGFDGSSGDYVFFLDSDDRLYPNAISSLVEAQQRTGAVVTMGNWNIIEYETGEIISTPGGVYKNEVSFDDLHAILSMPSIHGVTQNKLISREFWKKNDLYQTPGLFYEDNLWTFKLLTHITKGDKFCITPSITYIYNMREGSIMHSINSKQIKSYIKAVEVAFQIAESAPDENRWYAMKGLENFKRTALMNVIQKVEGNEVYNSVYAYIRNHNLVSVYDYLKCSEISFFNKLYYIHNLLPISIGLRLQYFLIKLQLKRSRSVNSHEKLKIDISSVNLYE